VLSETIFRADLPRMSEEWQKLFFSGGKDSVRRAVPLTDVLETIVTLWLQHPGALTGQDW